MVHCLFGTDGNTTSTTCTKAMLAVYIRKPLTFSFNDNYSIFRTVFFTFMAHYTFYNRCLKDDTYVLYNFYAFFPHIINILDSLQCGGGFQVTSYVNQEANVARVSEMINYGVVLLSTHGSGGGKAFLTGEIADTNEVAYQTYKPLLQGDDPKMGISINMTISKQGNAIK